MESGHRQEESLETLRRWPLQARWRSVRVGALFPTWVAPQVVGSPWKAGWTAAVLKLLFQDPLQSRKVMKPQGNFVYVGYICQYVPY